jgi:hypothetical protein
MNNNNSTLVFININMCGCPALIMEKPCRLADPTWGRPVRKSRIQLHRAGSRPRLLPAVVHMHLSTTQPVLLPQAHSMLASVILHLLLAQLAWTLPIVNRMQPKELLPPYPRKHRTTTGTLDHRNIMSTTLICGSLILGVVPFLSHRVLHVQKYYLTTQWNLHSCADI